MTFAPLRQTAPRRGATMLAATAVALLVLGACSSDGDESASTTSTTADPDAQIACDTAVDDTAPAPTQGPVRGLVDDLVESASLPEAEDYTDFQVVCDNVGVTLMVAPTDYADVEPTQGGPLQSTVRATRGWDGPVEEAPNIAFLVASVGEGTQFPIQPSFTVANDQSAEGSLGSGTRDPREGKTIAEECEAQPERAFQTRDFTGRAQFYVNCGGDDRAWVVAAAEPKSGDPYFFRLLAQVLDTADAEALGRAINNLSVDADALVRFDEGATTTTGGGSGNGDRATTTTEDGESTTTTEG